MYRESRRCSRDTYPASYIAKYTPIRRFHIKSQLEQAQGLSLSKFPDDFISQNLFVKSFCKSQFPHKSVNLSFSITNVKNKFTDLCGNWLLQNDFMKIFYETRPERSLGAPSRMSNPPAPRGLPAPFSTRHHPGDNPGANRWCVESTPIQMLPPGGSICWKFT